jgi:BlaI family transcriptional regulator, penicillinase repressor
MRTEKPLPPTKSVTLTEAELRLMDVLWQQGPSTVQQVLEALPGKSPLAYNSVLTTIRILEKKGYVRHIKDGRAYIYRALVEREEASRSEIRHLAHRFFQNSHEMLVLNILEERGVDAEELNRLRQLLEQTQPDGTNRE